MIDDPLDVQSTQKPFVVTIVPTFKKFHQNREWHLDKLQDNNFPPTRELYWPRGDNIPCNILTRLDMPYTVQEPTQRQLEFDNVSLWGPYLSYVAHGESPGAIFAECRAMSDQFEN